MLLMVLCSAGLGAGKDCNPFARPWLVDLSGHTGVLLNKWWVLTSYSLDGRYSKQVVRLGVDDLSGQSDTEQRIPVAEWINHDPYSFEERRRRRKRSPTYDLAMVRLAWPARFTTHVQPIPLPSHCASEGDMCVVAGWGFTMTSQCRDAPTVMPPKRQQCAVQPILSGDACSLYSDLLCVGYQHTTDPDCQVLDGGSVLVCDGMLQGIHGSRPGCSGKPETYSSICANRSWIDMIMGNRKLPKTSTTATTTSVTTTTLPEGYYT